MSKKLHKLFLSFSLLLAAGNGLAQNTAAYLKQNAVRIENPHNLSDSVYYLLSHFRVFLMGEMHGTKEPANFVAGLTELMTGKGDSVQVGLEIPSELMAKYLVSHTDSSIYMSDFFINPIVPSGRESFAWAKVISEFKNDPRVQLFFYDINEGEPKTSLGRDSMMYAKIKRQFILHPKWKIITLSGNVHSMTSPKYEIGRNTMASFLLQDKDLDLSAGICSINHFYSSGTALNSYGDGLKMHRIGSPPSPYTTATDYDSYIVLEPPAEPGNTPYPYISRYYTTEVTAAKMVAGNANISALRSELNGIYERDQKTRNGTDSAQYMTYIDSCNLARVAAVVDDYGWPGKTLVGVRANVAVFLVVQHAGIETQLKYLPLIQRSVDNNESRPTDLALLQDRILMRQGKKQIYGSQVTFNKTTGAQEFWQIEDEKNVNSRRSKIGLDTIEEYAKNFGIDYKSPKD